jgi:hypothetical protein
MDRSLNLTPEGAPYPQSLHSSDLRISDLNERPYRHKLGLINHEISPDYRLARKIARRPSQPKAAVKQDLLRPSTSQNKAREVKPSARWKSTAMNEEPPLFVSRQTQQKLQPRVPPTAAQGGSKLDTLASLAQEMKTMFQAMPGLPKPRLSKSMLHNSNPLQASQRLNASGIDRPVNKPRDLNVSTSSNKSRRSRRYSANRRPTQPTVARTPASVSARRGRSLRTREVESAAKVFEDFYAKSKVLLSELEEKVLGRR